MSSQPITEDPLSLIPANSSALGTVQRYGISHTLRFTYDAPIKLDQMVLRLQPRTGVDQRLLEFDIKVEPQPTRQSHGIDLHGNVRHWFWFEDQHESLSINTRSLVDCHCDNPFDFITVDDGARQVPAIYQEPVYTASAHYRQRDHPTNEINELARRLIDASGGKTRVFLQMLNEHINQQIRYIVRPEGEPWKPVETLANGEGSCRDSAVLFMDAARAAGLATRFVSGYAFDALDPTRRELHAWAEVYLPGGGWRGYDPTVGLAVANRHVPVAASPTPSYAAPTAGTFTGPPVRSTLEYHIEMIQSAVARLPGPPGTTYHWA